MANSLLIGGAKLGMDFLGSTYDDTIMIDRFKLGATYKI